MLKISKNFIFLQKIFNEDSDYFIAVLDLQ